MTSVRAGAMSHYAVLFTRPEWHARAACCGTNPASWVDAEQATAEQVATCSVCPVLTECSAWAESHRSDAVGVWAGRSRRDRAAARRVERKSA